MKDAGVSDVSLRLGAESVALSGGDARPESRGAGRVTDYLALLKPRVMSLVVFSGFAGLFAAPGELHPFLAAVAVLFIAAHAGAVGAIHMWCERELNAITVRKRRRPLPPGTMGTPSP